ncbi:MAG: hypothetical protein M9887_05110 [Chitinophagales bacterium]|nr:hypothetical protein [Chitinophagales bacterium]
MNSKNVKLDTGWIAIVFIVTLAVAIRILMNGKIPNFAPIGALALFAGAYIQNLKTAIILPITALLLSDLVLGMHSTMIFVYASFFMIILFSRAINGRNKSIAKTFGSTLLASVLFFLVTNFGVWLLTGMYSMDISGLLSSYMAGVPFFRYTLMGDLFYVTLFFGAYEGITHFVLPSIKTV